MVNGGTPPDELADKLEDWVTAGLIGADQAEAILAHEASPHPAEQEAARVSLATEAVGYLGGGLASIAAVIFLAQIWGELQSWAKVAFIGIVTAVPAVAGALIRGSSEPAVQRLVSFLWTLSVAGVAFVTALISGEILDTDDELVFLATSLAAAAYASVLWAVRRRALQELTFLAALISSLIALLVVLSEGGIDAFFVGLALWSLGLIWAILSWADIIEPPHVGVVAGAAVMLVAAQVASVDGYRVLGLWLGFATALGLLAGGVWERRSALLALGALGVIVFTPQLVLRIFGDTLGAPLALLVAGLALVVGAVAFVRGGGRLRRSEEIQR